MKVFLLVLFLLSISNSASNERMTKVILREYKSKEYTNLYLSPSEETYFYFEDKSDYSYVYFY